MHWTNLHFILGILKYYLFLKQDVVLLTCSKFVVLYSSFIQKPEGPIFQPFRFLCLMKKNRSWKYFDAFPIITDSKMIEEAFRWEGSL